MPFGETIGITLPAKARFPIVLFIAFLLGIGVTYAEPAIGALKTAGSIVDVGQAPYLYALLNEWSEVLVLCIGAGVGLATVLGTLRFFYGWSLKPLIYATLLPAMGLTIYIMFDSELSKTLGLAWDSGAVTTGPVTVPLVLSLGVGIAAAAGKGRSSLSGFGIVTLASIFPIVAVQILAIIIAQITSPEEIIAKAASTLAPATVTAEPWFARSPFVEMIMGMQAIVPLVAFLFLVMTFILRERIRKPGEIVYGITLAILGMIVFNLGLTYGLAKLGDQSGGLVPAAFTQIETVKSSPLYALEVGLFIAGAFAWLLGFGATLAEPALNTLGMTVQNLTNGAFRKSMLMYAVSFGVARSDDRTDYRALGTGRGLGFWQCDRCDRRVRNPSHGLDRAHNLGFGDRNLRTVASRNETQGRGGDRRGRTDGDDMNGKEIVVLTDVALITCIVQRGSADAVVKAAQNAGAQGATIYYGRGSGVRERLGLLGLAIEVEKEVINVVVSTDQVDRIFERMYIEGNLDAPGMGIMYVTPLDKAATYIPHEIVEEIAGKGLAKKR
jgi:nitrogen regulatory protein PII